MEHNAFDLIVGLATIGGFALQAAKELSNLCRKLSTRRIARQGKKDKEMREQAPENK